MAVILSGKIKVNDETSSIGWSGFWYHNHDENRKLPFSYNKIMQSTYSESIEQTKEKVEEDQGKDSDRIKKMILGQYFGQFKIKKGNNSPEDVEENFVLRLVPSESEESSGCVVIDGEGENDLGKFILNGEFRSSVGDLKITKQYYSSSATIKKRAAVKKQSAQSPLTLVGTPSSQADRRSKRTCTPSTQLAGYICGKKFQKSDATDGEVSLSTLPFTNSKSIGMPKTPREMKMLSSNDSSSSTSKSKNSDLSKSTKKTPKSSTKKKCTKKFFAKGLEGFHTAIIDNVTDDVYEGEWKNGLRSGKGICLYKNGFIYEGNWAHGEENGFGVLMKSDRIVVYMGEWQHGTICGEGTYRFDDGGVYTGSWIGNKRQGRGEYILPNGGRYIGEWRENVRNGHGIMTWSGGSSYIGDWVDDKRHGSGKLRLVTGLSYDGSWVEDSMEGKGICTYEDGQRYVGVFRRGIKEGRGTLTFTNGTVYEGHFRDDKMDGNGKFMLSKCVYGSNEDEIFFPIEIPNLSNNNEVDKK